jgi:hypothetical protein
MDKCLLIESKTNKVLVDCPLNQNPLEEVVVDMEAMQSFDFTLIQFYIIYKNKRESYLFLFISLIYINSKIFIFILNCYAPK